VRAVRRTEGVVDVHGGGARFDERPGEGGLVLLLLGVRNGQWVKRAD
jgi:hypothetical protein